MQPSCHFCSGLFTDPAGRDAILKNSFKYNRTYRSLKTTEAAGCSLCKLLLAQHNHHNPCPEDGEAAGDPLLTFSLSTFNHRYRGCGVPPENPWESTNALGPEVMVVGRGWNIVLRVQAQQSKTLVIAFF
jgi:hypothetical protein